jgi:D-sedoheptulose 7-phosphate isomerase
LDRTEQEFVASYLSDSYDTLKACAADTAARSTLIGFADIITTALGTRKKLMIAGNGGSAADAQHIAGEFVSRLFVDRAPLSAIALTTDSSVLTAVGNDYGYEKVFERQVLGLGNPGDVFLGISTSGKSPNILLALDVAKANGIKTLGFTGAHATAMNGKCDMVLAVPSTITSIIQQVHIVAAHIICGLVERRFVLSAPQAKPQ